MHLKTWLFWGVAAAGVGAFIYYRSTRPTVFHYTTEPIVSTTLEGKITATGTLSAHRTVQVGSQVSGRISALLVDYNSPVKKGQVIARIDRSLFETALSQARANLMSAQGNVAKIEAETEGARKNFERAKTLRANGLIGQVEYDDAETKYRSTLAQIQASQGAVAQATAAYKQAKVNLEYTTIYSPIDGVVISRAVDVGQTVAASFQAPILFTLAEDLKSMQVDTYISEADIGRLYPGMPATFVVDAFPGHTFVGKIRQIRNAPQTVQNVVTYDAVIDVSNPDEKLKPGMTANVSIVTERKDNVLAVPSAALRLNPPMSFIEKYASQISARPSNATGKARAIWVLKRGHQGVAMPERIPVRTGLTDGKLTEILAASESSQDALPKVGAEVILQIDVEGETKNKDTSKGGSGRSSPHGGGSPSRRMF